MKAETITNQRSFKKGGKKNPKQMKRKISLHSVQKKAIAWAEQHEHGIECIGKQFIEEPRALVDSNGQPTKGEK